MISTIPPIFESIGVFAAKHGVEPSLGMKVKVRKDHKFYQDWQEEYIIAGMKWNHYRLRVDVMIVQVDAIGIYYYHEGWKLADLEPA